MKIKISLSVLLLMGLFVIACGDDSSSSPVSEETSSSEEVVSSSFEKSSSSVQSSSSIESSSEESSSSLESSSSYVEKHLAWDYLNPALSYGEFTDGRDGRVYKYVDYEGYIRLMAENLNYADSVSNPNLLGSSWCPNNSLDSCSKYGRLYTWAAAMNAEPKYNYEKFDGRKGNEYFMEYQGLCPDGWLMYINDFMWKNILPHKDLGYCAQEGWPLPGCTNEFGFSVLPGGYYENGEFKDVGKNYYYWSLQGGDKETGGFGAFLITEGNYGISTARNINFTKAKTLGATVRCYQLIPVDSCDDPENPYCQSSSSVSEESGSSSASENDDSGEEDGGSSSEDQGEFVEE